LPLAKVKLADPKTCSPPLAKVSAAPSMVAPVVHTSSQIITVLMPAFNLHSSSLKAPSGSLLLAYDLVSARGWILTFQERQFMTGTPSSSDKP